LGTELQGNIAGGQNKCQLWPKTLVDTSRAYFWLIGILSLPAAELSKCRQLLREWQKDVSEKMKGSILTLEAKFISKKVFLEHGFEEYAPPKPAAVEKKDEEPMPTTKTPKKKDKGTVPPAGGFKKIKGSNPQEVRRQFLEHSMKAAGSSSSTNMGSTGRLRPGREVLNRMKFDRKYKIEDFVVGYIDRKEGILEKSVEEWEVFGQEDLMAYIKNLKDDETVWDKARKVDLVFGKKRE